MNVSHRLCVLAMLLLGFAARVYAFDSTYIDPDRAALHGVSLVIVDAIGNGELPPLFANASSTRLPNGPLSAYLLAVVALFDRSLTAAVVAGLLLNLLAVPLAYVIGRRLFNPQVGLIAALLLALSNWGVYLARGTWNQTFMETGAVLAVLAITEGLRRMRPGPLLWGIVACVCVAGSYMAGFFLPFQALIALTAVGIWRGRLRGAWIGSVMIVLALVAVYALALYSDGRISLILENDLGKLTRESGEGEAIASFLRNPLAHGLRLATNSLYAETWVSPGFPGAAALVLFEDVRTWLLSALITLGAGYWIVRDRRSAVWFMLMWCAALICLLLVLMLRDPGFRVPVYYLSSVAPVPHLAAACALDLLLKSASQRKKNAFASAATLIVLGVPLWSFFAAAHTVFAQPLPSPGFVPLRWYREATLQWRAQCSSMINAQEEIATGMFDEPARIVNGGASNTTVAAAFQRAPQGGMCASNSIGRLLPEADPLITHVPGGGFLRAARARPLTLTQVQANVNLGWSLLRHRAEISAPGVVTVQHIWRIDVLPDEPYGLWYFQPHIKLLAPDGRVIAVGVGTAIEGWAWRQGELIVSEVDIAVPAISLSGEVLVQSSLFDPNQRKNAVYFYPSAPATPVLAIETRVAVK